MTEIPTIEKTETAKCHICGCDCMRLCSVCGNNYCTRHLISHSESCSGFKGVVQHILRDNLSEISKHVIEAFLRSI